MTFLRLEQPWMRLSPRCPRRLSQLRRQPMVPSGRLTHERARLRAIEQTTDYMVRSIESVGLMVVLQSDIEIMSNKVTMAKAIADKGDDCNSKEVSSLLQQVLMVLTQ